MVDRGCDVVRYAGVHLRVQEHEVEQEKQAEEDECDVV